MISQNDSDIHKIGFGGGCHWCTEAYFQSVKGVTKTEQGWLNSYPPHDSFSEAVIVHYDPAIVPVNILIEIHLHTHACTSNHSLREKYRSAIYLFDDKAAAAKKIISENQIHFHEQIITEVLAFKSFKLNTEDYLNYYQKNKEGEFCERYISPKLRMMEEKFAEYFGKR